MAFNELLKQKQELAAKLASLEKQIEDARREERADVISKIHAMMAEHDIRISDLGGRPGKRKSSASTAGRKLPAKYRDPATGDSWTGRGIRPKWLQAKLESGRKLEDFAV